MPYTGNPSTSVTDAVRLLVHDTSTSTGTELLTDAEYQWFIAQNSNLYFAASEAAGSIAASQTDTVISKKVGDLAWAKDSDGPTAAYLNLSARLRTSGLRRGVTPYAGGISKADKALNRSDTDWDRTFTTGGSNPAIVGF